MNRYLIQEGWKGDSGEVLPSLQAPKLLPQPCPARLPTQASDLTAGRLMQPGVDVPKCDEGSQSL